MNRRWFNVERQMKDWSRKQQIEGIGSHIRIDSKCLEADDDDISSLRSQSKSEIWHEMFILGVKKEGWWR